MPTDWTALAGIVSTGAVGIIVPIVNGYREDARARLQHTTDREKAADEALHLRLDSEGELLEVAGLALSEAVAAATACSPVRDSYRVGEVTDDEADLAFSAARESLNRLRVRYGPAHPLAVSFNETVYAAARLRGTGMSTGDDVALLERTMALKVARLSRRQMLDARGAFFERAHEATRPGGEMSPYDVDAELRDEIRAVIDEFNRMTTGHMPT